MKQTQKFLLIVIIVGFLSGLVGGVVTNEYVVSYLFSRFKGTEALEPVVKRVVEERTYVEESSTIDAIKKVSSSVVSIVATKDLKIYRSQGFPFQDPFSQEFFGFPFEQQIPEKQGKPEIKKQKIGGGSGFVVTADGLVITNAHVVSDGGAEYSAILSDGSEFPVEVLSADMLNDVAFVKIQKDKGKTGAKKVSTFKPVEFGDSDSLQVGQKVLAIGYALGEFENTVTAGIVSAKGRNIRASDGRSYQEDLFGLIQVDAPINFGNSGGPLVNLEGQVVGLNAAVASGQGIGFAIPINDVKPILESLQKYGKIVRPWLGVRHIILTKENAKELQIGVDQGALLVGDEGKGEFAVIPGSPADKAGLRIKDVILQVDGKDVTEEDTLPRLLRKYRPGEKVKLKVWRSGKTFDIVATLGEAPESLKK